MDLISATHDEFAHETLEKQSVPRGLFALHLQWQWILCIIVLAEFRW